MGHRLLSTCIVVLATWACHVPGSCAAAEAKATPPEADMFFRAPDIHAASLSPSGDWLALLSRESEGRIALVVFDVRNWKPVGVAARYGNADVGWFAWLGDERLVYSLSKAGRTVADEVFHPGLYVVDRAGRDRRQLISHGAPIDLLHVPDRGDEIVVGEWVLDKDGDDRHVNAKRLNVVTGRTVSLALGAPDHVVSWLFDASGEPRLVTTRRRAKGAYFWRAEGQSGWRRLAEFDWTARPYTPDHIDPEGGLNVLVVDAASDSEALKRLDLNTGRPVGEPLVRTPGFDYWGMPIDDVDGTRTLGRYVITDGPTTVWFDGRLKALQLEADRRFPGSANHVRCRRCTQDDVVALVRTESDRDPGHYWIHFGARKEWRSIGAVRPAINPEQMGTTDLHRVRSRDGTDLPVWVTRPSGAAKDAALPAVVLLRGWPWSRHRSWKWDALVQFLATRGYLVIEPEYRGRYGYGQKRYRAGWKQWGRAMQDDIADALAWAVQRGLADKHRVCIAGDKHGGYSALMGLVRHPSLYRCAAAWNAVADPRLLLEWRSSEGFITDYREGKFPAWIGDPVAEGAMLDEVAPVKRAAEIKAPVLLAHDDEDRSLPIDHGIRLRDALTAAGNAPEWVVYRAAREQKSREDWTEFAGRLQRFLDKHLAR